MIASLTSVRLHILLTHLLMSPILGSHCPVLHSTHNWKQNYLRYPIPGRLLHHDTSAIIADCNRSTTLSPRLDLSGFLPGTETKREVWLLRTGFGRPKAPVNKLVSLTWLLWALRSFRSFTLHYITLHYNQLHSNATIPYVLERSCEGGIGSCKISFDGQSLPLSSQRSMPIDNTKLRFYDTVYRNLIVTCITSLAVHYRYATTLVTEV